jgi:hypothetical protein
VAKWKDLAFLLPEKRGCRSDANASHIKPKPIRVYLAQICGELLWFSIMAIPAIPSDYGNFFCPARAFLVLPSELVEKSRSAPMWVAGCTKLKLM